MVAQTIVDEARRKGLDLAVPRDVLETPGEGVEGCVEGRFTPMRWMGRNIDGNFVISGD
jgi:hypothetical protein